MDEVLGEDAGDKVPMEKVVMLIWQFRDDPTVITFMARFMAKVRSLLLFDPVFSLAFVLNYIKVCWSATGLGWN